MSVSRVIKTEPIAGAPTMRDRFLAYLKGELTWAELEGMTFEQAQSIAEVGCDLASLGKLEESRIIFEGLVVGNPKDPATRAALGTVYQRLGRTDEARAEYEAAIELDADHTVALAHRGELRLRAGDREGVADLRRAIATDPRGDTAAGRRAKALVEGVKS